MARRGLAVGAIVVVALAAVALAARGDHRDATSAALGVPESTATIVTAALAIVGAVVLAVIAWALGGARGTRTPRATDRRRRWIALVLVCVAVGALALRHRRVRPHVRTPPGTIAVTATTVPRAKSRPAPPASATASLSIITLSGVGLLVAAAILASRSRRSREAVDEPAPDEPAADVDFVFDAALDAQDLRMMAADERDPRRAIAMAFAAAERAAAQTPFARVTSASAREWSRAVAARDTNLGGILNPLAARFEEARFSTHPITGVDRDLALAALDRFLFEMVTPVPHP